MPELSPAQQRAIDDRINRQFSQYLRKKFWGGGPPADNQVPQWDSTKQRWEFVTFSGASDTNPGIVELATIAETDTGTDTGRAVTPDGLQGSIRNLRFVDIRIVAADTDVATGTDLFGDWVCPFACTIVQDDSNPYWFMAWNDTAGTTGTMVIDVNLNGSTIMTTNKLDIETTEKSTATAATQPDLTTTDVAAGGIFTFDVDAIHTTAAKGLVVRLPLRPD